MKTDKSSNSKCIDNINSNKSMETARHLKHGASMNIRCQLTVQALFCLPVNKSFPTVL